MCHCRIMNCNKCTSLVGDVPKGDGGYSCGGKVWNIQEISAPSPQFCYKPTTAART